MFNKFVPKMYIKDIFSINYNKLYELGYKLIIFDLDNTIGHIKEEKCSLKTSKFINELTKKFIVVIVSNSTKNRVFKFCRNLDCDCLYFSLKPTLKSLRKIKKKYQISYKKMVIVGDQIMTDVLVGNRKDLLTILIDPIKNIDLKVTKINRIFENYINKKNNLVRGNYYEKK